MHQMQILRKMTGEQRLEQAFRLSEVTRELAVLNIKEMLGKNASKKKIIVELKNRMYGK